MIPGEKESQDQVFDHSQYSSFGDFLNAFIPEPENLPGTDWIEHHSVSEWENLHEATRNFGDFTGFDVTDSFPEEGEHTFVVRAATLRACLAVAAFTLPSKSNPWRHVRISVFHTALRVQTTDGGALLESFIPLTEKVDTIVDGQPISFIVLFDDLMAAAQAIEEKARFTLRGGLFTSRTTPDPIRVETENFERPLKLYPPKVFLRFDGTRIGAVDSASRRPVDGTLLLRAISYVESALEENHVSPALSTVELRNGCLVGGTFSCIALAASPKFDRWGDWGLGLEWLLHSG